MKNLMAKIKGFDYKGFFLRHGEKVGMGLTTVIVLVCLLITNWSTPFDKTPQQMQDEAQNVEKILRTNIWPAEKKSEFSLLTAERAESMLTAQVALEPFRHYIPLSPKVYTYRAPADEPVVLSVFDLRVSSGAMAMSVTVPYSEEEEAAALAAAEEAAFPGGRNDRGGLPRDRGGERGPERGLGGKGAGTGAGKALAGGKGAGAGAAGKGAGAGKGLAGGKGGGRGLPMGGGAVADTGADFAGGGMPGMAGMMGAGYGNPSTKARGARFNAVTGYVNVKDQLDRLQKALHLESAADAIEYLEYVDFKIQRQRAVRGPDPWKDDQGQERPWVDLDINLAMEVLENEASDFSADVVASHYISDAITSPLPYRLDGDWDPSEVGHPKVPALDEEEREFEALTNRIAAELAAEEENDPEVVRSRRGFRKVQKDANQMRQRAMGAAGDDATMRDALKRNLPTSRRNRDDYDEEEMGSRLRRAFGGGGPAAAGGRGMPGRAGARPMSGNPMVGMPMSGNPMAGMPGRGKAGMTRMAPPMGGMGGMGAMGGDPYGAGAYGMGGGMSGGMADVLLFRFFDFEIEPGECYRYRVKLIISNPSEYEEFVSSPEVANGPDRESDWSKPSTPVVVPKDLDYSLVRVVRQAGRRVGAELSVVQFDTDAGTLIANTLKPHFGQYVAGTQKSSHLRLDVPSLEDEEVKFTSQEILVDSATAPAVSTSALQDLKLNPKQLQKLVDGGGLDQAVTLTRFGELTPIDADSVVNTKEPKKRYEEQNEEYADLKDLGTDADGGLNMGIYGNMEDENPRFGKGRGATSSLKRGGRGGRGGAAMDAGDGLGGMMGPAAGAAGNRGGGKGKRGR